MTFSVCCIRKKGARNIDGEDQVEKFRRCVPDRAAVGQSGRVDKDVDAPEGLVGRIDDFLHVRRIGQIGRHENRFHAFRFESLLPARHLRRCAR